ncbi:helix-turn-helix domain-containing protein [Paraflavitalea speifideaquila]|uniref:helix-turn-helix domain-containing protein n=1 Tax=Paraflavitalea speifideaquila TaxID=3076558 RepID=UPI0033130274
MEAKQLLQSTTRPIKEIAFELGAIDHAYCSKFFRAQTGSTPTDLRDNTYTLWPFSK